MRYPVTATPRSLCPEYRAGDTVTYRVFGGELRTVRVTARLTDVKNGQPGFDGVLPSGATVWGYDVQIEAVQS